MSDFGAGKVSDQVILVARVLLVILFLVFGWSKLSDFSGTVDYMAKAGLPAPQLAALVAIAIELPVSAALVFGVWTRPLSILLALYALATAIVGHPYWSMAGAEQYDNMINFYKNISISGGFLLLYVTGGGRFSLDARLRLSNGAHREGLS